MPSPFKSIYAPYIQELINSRKVLGFKCNTEAVILHGFDLFAAQRGEKNLGITKELAEAWKQCKPNESSSYYLLHSIGDILIPIERNNQGYVLLNTF